MAQPRLVGGGGRSAAPEVLHPAGDLQGRRGDEERGVTGHEGVAGGSHDRSHGGGSQRTNAGQVALLN